MASGNGIGRLLRRFARDETGATAIEYAIVAVGIAVAVAGAIRLTGSSLQTNFYSEMDKATRH